MTINARDGGTDANDWAEMLLRMYIQWANDQGYGIELLDRVRTTAWPASKARRSPFAGRWPTAI